MMKKVMTDDREKIEYIWNKMKKIKKWLKRKKDQVYLNWLDIVETMLNDEEKSLHGGDHRRSGLYRYAVE